MNAHVVKIPNAEKYQYFFHASICHFLTNQSALFPVLNVCTLMRTAAALKQKCTPRHQYVRFLSPSPNQKVRLLRTCLRAIRVELGLVWWHLVVKVEVCRGLHDDGGPTEVRRVAGVTWLRRGCLHCWRELFSGDHVTFRRGRRRLAGSLPVQLREEEKVKRFSALHLRARQTADIGLNQYSLAAWGWIWNLIGWIKPFYSSWHWPALLRDLGRWDSFGQKLTYDAMSWQVGCSETMLKWVEKFRLDKSSALRPSCGVCGPKTHWHFIASQPSE